MKAKMVLDLFRRLLSRNRGKLLRSFIFFVLFYLYLWFEIDLRLIYHGSGELTNFPVFYLGWTFFHETIWYLGGLIEYISAFLSQFLYYSWAGAIVLTVHAWLIYTCTSYFLKAIKADRFHFVSFIPAILLLITYNKYTYHFTTTTALLAALAFLCLYVKAAPKSKLLSVLFFLLLSVLLYIIAGAAYLLFAVVCGIYEVFFKRRFETGLLYFLSAAVIPYLIGVMVFSVSIIDAYSELLPISWKIISFPGRRIMIELVYALYLLLPVIAIALGLWWYFAAKLTLLLHRATVSEPQDDEKGEQQTGDESSASGPEIASRHRWTIDFELLAVLVIATAAVFFSRDYQRKTMFEIDYYACRRNWQKVLSVSRRRPLNHLIVHMVNRALYHTGRLPYDMFSYSQHPKGLLLSSKEHMLEHWRRFDTYYDLGTMNHCECALVESLELYGERPEILKRLAMVKMAKGELNAARVYLGALSKTLFYSGWAKSYLQQLESDPNLSADEEIQRLRSLMPEKDEGSIDFPVEKIFSELLEKNRQNQMAFEYLMAWYMLNRQLDEFVQNITRLDDFDYPKIPRYYEEAILTYMFKTKKAVNLHGHNISGQSVRRFRNFIQTANRHRTDKEAAFSELAKNYGDSYFFYYAYGVSGLKK